MSTHSVVVNFTFEAAHRLPQLGGKCRNLHGHSWQAAIAVCAPQLTDQCIVVEFGQFKSLIRDWIDNNLDHATMIGVNDEFLPFLRSHDSKVFVFGDGDCEPSDQYYAKGLEWPTVEAVAVVLHRAASGILCLVDGGERAYVLRVDVNETAINRAVYIS